MLSSSLFRYLSVISFPLRPSFGHSVVLVLVRPFVELQQKHPFVWNGRENSFTPLRTINILEFSEKRMNGTREIRQKTDTTQNLEERHLPKNMYSCSFQESQTEKLAWTHIQEEWRNEGMRKVFSTGEKMTWIIDRGENERGMNDPL